MNNETDLDVQLNALAINLEPVQLILCLHHNLARGEATLAPSPPHAIVRIDIGDLADTSHDVFELGPASKEFGQFLIV